MGFDIYGNKPDSEEKWDEANPGYYFRNNIWWWKPLWNVVCAVGEDKGILTTEDIEGGYCNDGYFIGPEKAVALSAALEEAINSGEVESYENSRQEWIRHHPLQDCWFCKGLGTSDNVDMNDRDNLCRICRGTGKVNNSQKMYPFDIENVRNFVKFMANSSGFSIH